MLYKLRTQTLFAQQRPAIDDALFLFIFKLKHLQINTSSFAIGMVVEIPQQAVAMLWREELQRTARLFSWGKSVGEKRLPKVPLRQFTKSSHYLIVVDNSSMASIGFKAFNRNSSSIVISGNSYFMQRYSFSSVFLFM